MENVESVSMGLMVSLLVMVISLLTSIILLIAGFVIKGISNSTKDSHHRIDELIIKNNEEHTEIRTLCMKG
jgi:low affinity Fe/Cu permease